MTWMNLLDAPADPHLRLEDVLESVSDGFYAVDSDWRYVVFNRAAEEFFGVDRAQVLGQRMWDVFPQGRGTRFEEACNAAMAEGLVTHFETKSALRADRVVELRIGPLVGGGVTVALTDVTERALATERLRQVSERNSELAAEREAVLAQLLEGVILADAEGKITFVNEAAERIHGVAELGVAPEDYTATYQLFTADGDPYPFEQLPLMRAVRDGETVLDATWRIRPPGREEVRASGSARPIENADGVRIGAVLTVRDDTQRQLAEEKVRETTSRLDAILSNTQMAIFLMDERQHCAYMNDAAVRLTGYTWQETQGRPLHDVIHHTRPDGSHYPLGECPIDRAFPENNQQQGEDVFVHKDGRFYPVAFTASPIRDSASRTVGTIIEVRDITEERRNQQARELLMREVDHRSRNMLAVAQSMVQLTRAENVPEFREALLGRVNALSRAQSALAKGAWTGASLAEVVDEELKAFAGGENYSSCGPDLRLRPDQVQPLAMILHELATNAAKYGALSGREGRVLVSWSCAWPYSLRLEWLESGGPEVIAPTREGFGTRLITTLAKQLGASVHFEWPATGLVVTLAIRGDAAGGLLGTPAR
jgi:PAS domain S-box-containing protein